MSAPKKPSQTPAPDPTVGAGTPKAGTRGTAKLAANATPAAKAFVEAVRISELLCAAQREQLPQIEKRFFPDLGAYAKELVRLDWFTRYQIEQLAVGRGKDLVLGPYQLLELLGEGGMGKVYKARHTRMDRIVALKVIRPDLMANPDNVQRFRREVRAAAQLAHANVVLAYDADQVGDTHYLALEYVEGSDLARLVKEQGPLSIAHACDAIRQAAVALQHAKERGLVHRDIKPSNLLWSPQTGLVKLLDLGLALLNRPALADEETGSSLTHTGAVMGTPDYMAPEQAADTHHADIRADLYSLGCTFYFLLTGQVPFPGGSMFTKLCKHREAAPEPLTKLRPNIPPEVAGVVGKLMAKSPKDRFQSPKELAAVLDALLKGTELPTEMWQAPTISATPARTAEATAASASTDNMFQDWATIVAGTKQLPTFLTPLSSPQLKSRRRFWITAAAGIPLGLLAALALTFFFKSPPRPTEPDMKELAGGKPEPARLEVRPRAKPATEPGAEKPAEPEPEPSKPVALTALAHLPWQDTRVDVEAGKPLTILVKGEWRRGKSACTVDGLAAASAERNVLPEAPAMCLLARIGDEETPFVLGTKTTLQPRQSGRLFVQANDLDLKETSGSLQLEIEGGKPGKEAAPTPTPTRVEAAAKALPALLERVAGKKAEPDRLWAEALAFRLRHAGTPQVARVAEATKPLPSALDALVPARIPRREVFAWQKNVVAVLGEHRWWHGAKVNGIALSADSKQVATAGEDGLVRVWDTTTGKGRVFRGHTEGVMSVTFPANAKTLVSGSRSGSGMNIKIWNLANGKELTSLAATHHAFCLATHDNRLLAAGCQGGVGDVWDLSRGAEKINLKGHTGQTLPCLTFSPDGKHLATGGEDRVAKLWNVHTTKDRISGKGTVPGQLVGVKEKHNLNGHVGAILGLAFSPDNQLLATGSFDTTVKVWHVPSGADKISLQGHKAPVTAVAFTADGKQVVSLAENVRYWDPATGLEKASVPVPPMATAPAVFARDRKLIAAAGRDGVIQLWDPATGKTWSAEQEQTIPVTTVAFAPDGKTLASAGGGAAGMVKLWDPTAAKERTAFEAHAQTINCLEYSPDGKLLATGSDDGTVKLWDTERNAERAVLKGHSGPILCLTFTADGRMLASGSADKTAKLWNVEDGKERFTLKGHTKAVLSLAFAPHGRVLATGSEDWSAKIWDVGTGQERSTINQDAYPVTALAFSLDGRALALAQQGATVCFYALYPLLRLTTERVQTGFSSVVFLPDGKGAVTGSLDGRLDYWDFTKGIEGSKATLICQMEGGIYSLAVAPDGRHVAAGHAGGTIYIFRLPQGTMLSAN